MQKTECTDKNKTNTHNGKANESETAKKPVQNNHGQSQRDLLIGVLVLGALCIVGVSELNDDTGASFRTRGVAGVLIEIWQHKTLAFQILERFALNLFRETQLQLRQIGTEETRLKLQQECKYME